MKIEHIAIWTKDLVRLKNFYSKYFEVQSFSHYLNEKNQFESYFLTFESGARLELMKRPDIEDLEGSSEQEYSGYAHLAMSTGSEKRVDDLTKKLTDDGYKILAGPRRTGDGNYESVALDPDGNRIEITV
jgi:lactoylglutathione lyase